MKKIIVCDSGLGGLNIAGRLFRNTAEVTEKAALIYFNAYPDAETGFNKLPSGEAQERLLRTVLESMERFSPDRCLIACNTLSIVYERLARYWRPSFPVSGIIDAAVEGMAGALAADPGSQLLILGTKTTVGSGAYARKLLDRGIAPERIKALACPGLATLLESDPAAPEVVQRIREYAAMAAGIIGPGCKKVYLALCCTHFEFAGELWQEEFGRALPGTGIGIVNPNGALAGGIAVDRCRYLSRIGFFPGAKEAMSKYFAASAPLLALALNTAEPDENLFEFNKSEYLQE